MCVYLDLYKQEKLLTQRASPVTLVCDSLVKEFLPFFLDLC